MDLSRVTTHQEWLKASDDLRVQEQDLLRARDALAAGRRRMPMVEIHKDYAFDGPAGAVDLPELFEGRGQLLVYHFWFEPGDEEPCAGCTMWINNLGHVAALLDQGISLAVVSRVPSAEIEEWKQRRGWTVPWLSTVDDFGEDVGYTGEAQITAFARDGAAVFLASTISGRALEMLGNQWTLLDLTPHGAN